jgi:hypothetical protein
MTREFVYYIINLYIEASVPLIFVCGIAFQKVFPSWSHEWIPFPISIGYPILPLASFVAFFYVLQHASPWFYIGLGPTKKKKKKLKKVKA